MIAPIARGVVIALVVCVQPPALLAQCSTVLAPGDGVLGANSNVYAAAPWDPDGAGPLGTHLVVGGEFTILANVYGNPAMFDPATHTWSALPGLQPSRIECFCTRANGDLVAGGLWVSPTSMLASWNGATWTPIAPTMLQEVTRVVVRGSHLVASTYSAVYDIDVATGAFTSILPTPAQALLTLPNGDVLFGMAGSIQRWNGSAVLPFASTDGPVVTLTTLPNGDVLASGGFTTVGGVAAAGLARWDGTSWHAVAPGVPVSVRAVPMPNGDIVVSGFFTSIGGVPADYIARWDGIVWAPLGAGLNGQASGLAALPGGDLFAVGNNFNTAGGATTRYIAHHDGTTWQRVGGSAPGSRTADVAQLPDGDVVAVGYFTEVGSTPAVHAARRHEGTWLPMGNLSLTPLAVICGSTGRVFAGGYSDMHQWTGSQWVSTNMAPGTGHVASLAELANGDVVAGGSFAAAGGLAASNIARWNGTTWSPMGTGLPVKVTSIVQMPDGSVVAAARHVYRWDGVAWTQLGSIAPGWSVNGATRLVVHPDGSLWATGELTLGVVARWNGTAWSAIASQPNHSGGRLVALPDGDVVVFGRSFVYPNLPAGSRWDGTSWSQLAADFRLVPTSGFEEVEEITWLPHGELVAVGYFNVVNGQVAPYIASFGTTCPATTSKYGAGCIGSAGPVQLTVVEPAWVGGNLRATTTGIPSGAFAIGIAGLVPIQIPLPSILPTGQTGCDLLTTVDALWLLQPAGLSVQSTIPIPNAPLYLDKQFFHQVAVLELDAVGGLGPLTSSNAIEVHVGDF